MSATSTPRRRPGFPGSLTDLHRFRKTAHGHDGSSRIVMVRKTDQRTFASIQQGQEPKLETITRETIETFRGQRTEFKITTETKDLEKKCPPDIINALTDKVVKVKKKPVVKKLSLMDFHKECLNAHNEFRKKHGVPPLKLNKEISKFSQEWADNLIKKGVLQHSSNEKYGENLFSSQSSNPNFTVKGNEAVDAWYDEIKVHTFGVEPKNLGSGHFTQVVWKDSKELGVGFAKSKGKVIVVCNYYPPGNYVGNYNQNVPPPGGFSTNNNNDALASKMTDLSINDSKKDVKKGTEGNFEEDFLKAHNIYRARHGVPLLKLDKKLCKYSEEWAKHLASKNILEHRPESNYGENIYCLRTNDPNYTINGNTPVDTWYEEAKEHNYSVEPTSLRTGHFTQLIWKESEKLGVGFAKNSQNTIYVVANYDPPGNFTNNFVDNVPPPLSSCLPRGDSSGNLKPAYTSSLNQDGSFNEFAIDSLKIHNEYRRKHGVPDLKLNQEMCKFAQEWAQTCADTSSLQHRANNPYGENVFSVYSSDMNHTPSARDAIKEWYDEIKKFVFGEEKVIRETLHFTQIVWKNSTELGVGIAKNNKGQSYVVANYNPKGNYIGQFVQNVPKPKP